MSKVTNCAECDGEGKRLIVIMGDKERTVQCFACQGRGRLRHLQPTESKLSEQTIAPAWWLMIMDYAITLADEPDYS